MSNEEDRREEERERVQAFISALIPYGYSDVCATTNLLKEYGLSMEEGAEAVEEFCDSTGTPLVGKNDTLIDTTYVIYDYILQKARTNIEEITGNDILNDTQNQVYAYGNYCCSGFDYSGDAIEEIQKIIKGHKLEEFDELTQTFLKEIEAV